MSEERSLTSDIKLENVVIMHDDTMKLIDFDAVLEISPSEPRRHVDFLVGTRDYLAPECWHGVYSTASDMYAVGVLVCYILFQDSFAALKADQLDESSSIREEHLHLL